MSFLEHNPFSTLQMITMLIFQVTSSFIFLRVLLARYACLNYIVLFYVFLIFFKGKSYQDCVLVLSLNIT